MSDRLKTTLQTIIGMDKGELRIVAVVSNALMAQVSDAHIYGLNPIMTVDPNLMGVIPDLKPGVVLGRVPNEARQTDQRKVKTKKAKEVDAAARLAALEGKRKGKGKGNTNAEAPDVYTGLTGRVVEALKQTTGKVTSIELAEILEVKPTQKVSEVLSSGVKQGRIKGLKREPGKSILPSGKVVPTYLYWLEGGK